MLVNLILFIYIPTVNAVKRARQWGIPVRVSCIVTNANEGLIGDIRQFVDDLGAAYGGQDAARPTGRGAAASCRTTIPGQMVGPPFYTSRKAFAEARCFNPCWKGKITVSDDGSVLPCVFARGRIAGNVRNQSLTEIINSGNMDRFWGMSKDRVRICRDCEFRYACPDCRPLALGWHDGDLSAKTYGCNYDPYSGKWQ